MQNFAAQIYKVRAAPYKLDFATMHNQADMPPMPLLPLKHQIDAWSKDLRMPESLVTTWLRFAGVARAWRKFEKSPELLEEFDTHSAWRPSPSIWSNFTAVPETFGKGNSSADPLLRAANLILIMRDLRDDFFNRRLTPEYSGKHTQDLSQFINIFRGIGVINEKPCWCAPDYDGEHFCVLANGIPYFMPMPDSTTGAATIQCALQEIYADRKKTGRQSFTAVSSLGIKPFENKIGGHNPEAIRLANAIAASCFVLCLDLDELPADKAHTGSLTHTNFKNRWYFHGCNLAIFGNSAVGIHLSFGGGIDGNVGARFASELSSRLQIVEQASNSSSIENSTCVATFIRGTDVKISQEQLHFFESAAQSFVKNSSDVFTLPIGDDDCQLSKVRPVDSFVIALAAALSSLCDKNGNRPEKRPTPIRQFISQGRYKFGTLNAVDVNMAATFKIALEILQPDDQSSGTQTLRQLYDVASTQIRDISNKTRQLRAFNRSFTAGAWQRAIAYTVIAPVLLPYRLWKWLRKPHSIIKEAAISYVAKKDGIAIIARPGVRAPKNMLWLHYQIFADHTLIVPCFGNGVPLQEHILIKEIEHCWTTLLKRMVQN